MSTRNQTRRSQVTARDLPGQMLEHVLAEVPFSQRVMASAVCRAWRQHLSQRGLLLWQAASIGDDHEWLGGFEEKLRLFLPLQHWLGRYGGGLLQLQCSTSFDRKGKADTGLLSALLTAIAVAAPSLQALRLDASAARGLTGAGLVGVAGMGSRLRQLALVGLQRTSAVDIVTVLAQLPMLQDLAVMFVNERVVRLQQRWDAEDGYAEQEDEMPYISPDFMQLLGDIITTRPALQTLAVGQLPRREHWKHWSDFTCAPKPLPASMSRLTALSSLLLTNVGWEYASNGLPALPQLRRLSLRGAVIPSDKREHKSEFGHQLSTLTALEALQISLPVWPGRLPPGLTQLAVSPLVAWHWESDTRITGCSSFLRMHLPELRSLRHLAFHSLQEIGDTFLPEVCTTVAGALPQLVSLHLVDCNIHALPEEFYELSHLQLLNLSENPLMEYDGFIGASLSEATLHKLSSCKQLNLMCGGPRYDEYRLDDGAIASIAQMPALQQLALSPIDEGSGSVAAFPEELAELAQSRGPGLPPIKVTVGIPESDEWASVSVEMPFEAANDMLGVQLDRSIVPGVLVNHTAPEEYEECRGLDSDIYSD